MVLGLKGAGKSSVGNALVNESYFKEGDVHLPGANIRRVKVSNVNLEVMDTPTCVTGESSSFYNFVTEDFAHDFATVCFCVSVADLDKLEEVMKMLRTCGEILGEAGLRKFRIVFTQLNKVSKIERGYARLNEYFAQMKASLDESGFTLEGSPVFFEKQLGLMDNGLLPIINALK